MFATSGCIGKTVRMRALTAGGGGFLLAVLWMDLMFDVQVRGHAAAAVPVDVLDSISRYYARVTTSSQPRGRLIAVMMLITIIGAVGLVVRREVPTWRAIIVLLLILAAVVVAGSRTVKNAVRLGSRGDDTAGQSRLAHLIYFDHRLCGVCIAASLVLVLAPI